MHLKYSEERSTSTKEISNMCVLKTYEEIPDRAWRWNERKWKGNGELRTIYSPTGGMSTYLGESPKACYSEIIKKVSPLD